MPTKGLTPNEIAYYRKVIHNYELDKYGNQTYEPARKQREFEENDVIYCGSTTEVEDLQADIECQHGKSNDPCRTFDSHVSLFKE